MSDGDALIAFLESAFDGLVHEVHHDESGRMTHADVQVGDSRMMLGEASAEYPALRAMIHLFVPDADAVYAKAIAAGATSLREPETLFYGHRSAGVEDPSGRQWWISTQVEELTAEEIERRMREAAGT